ncbi:MAG: FkbM family methyltransferase [Desulfovibrio sp.]|nr:FkbM family methyltransferase [Desulfovibrio sp.]
MSYRFATTLRPALLPLLSAAPRLVYVDCGARAESANPLVDIFPEGRYIGFEPDEEECRRLNAAARPNYRFHPVALAGEAGELPFHVTANPACSSLYAPDPLSLADYEGVDGFLTPERTVRLRTDTLDAFLASIGEETIHCFELDTQGSELDILRGAVGALDGPILAVKAEVEFVPQYLEQPLFGEVDAFLREHRFALFALSPRCLRWKGLPRDIASDGQLLWAHALYLKRPEALPAEAGAHILQAVIASCQGVHDYAQAVLARGAERLGGPDPAGAARLTALREGLLAALPRQAGPESPQPGPAWKRFAASLLRAALRRLG